MISPLTETLARQAYLQGLLGGTTAQGAASVMQPQASVNVRRAQQEGGHRSRPGVSGAADGRGGGLGSLFGSVAGTVLGGPLWGMAGSALGGLFDGGGRRRRPTGRTSLSLGQQYPELGQQFRQTLGSWLGGEAGLPPEQYQQALTRGMAGINQQAQFSRQNLMGALGRRGLLHSGAVVSGLGEIERGRLGSLGDYYGAMQQSDFDARRQSLLNAMEIMGGSREQAAGAQAGREQIRMQQPSTWDYLAELAGAAAPYLLGSPTTSDYDGLLDALSAGMSSAAPAPAPATRSTGWRSPLPPGWGFRYGVT